MKWMLMASGCGWDVCGNVGGSLGLIWHFVNVWSMRVVINWVRFANGMPRFQEQSTRPQGTAVYDLDIIKIKFVVVFHTVLRQKRVLVTCEDGSFMFFCSGSQCSGCLTDVKFFTVFTIDFIHNTSWQVLVEFVLRFLQDRTNRFDGFMIKL